MTNRLVIYGASDDLIEVEGAIREELDPPYGKPCIVTVRVDDATYVSVRGLVAVARASVRDLRRRHRGAPDRPRRPRGRAMTRTQPTTDPANVPGRSDFEETL